MSVRKFPDRYWMDIEQSEDEPQFNVEMEALANKVHEGRLSFTSHSLADTREIQRQARKLYQKYFPHMSDDEIGLKITTQPICPKCGQIGAFSDEFCSDCGEKLLPKGTVLDDGNIEDW